MTVATPQAETTGALFRRRRQERGATLEQIARTSGVALSTLIRIEQGHRSPRRGTAAAIAAALGVSDAELEQTESPTSP